MGDLPQISEWEISVLLPPCLSSADMRCRHALVGPRELLVVAPAGCPGVVACVPVHCHVPKLVRWRGSMDIQQELLGAEAFAEDGVPIRFDPARSRP